ncbi:hypothetical protein GCM10009429_30550 [Dyella marensis]
MGKQKRRLQHARLACPVRPDKDMNPLAQLDIRFGKATQPANPQTLQPHDASPEARTPERLSTAPALLAGMLTDPARIPAAIRGATA